LTGPDYNMTSREACTITEAAQVHAPTRSLGQPKIC